MSPRALTKTESFGRHDLPETQQDTLHKAIRVERITIIIRVATVGLIMALSGSSQAMKAAWIEDSLSILPPLAFLVAIRFIRRGATASHPYGYHRSVGVGHLIASTALLGMGLFLLVDSGMGLLTAEHPPIGLVEIFGTPVWAGWLMAIAVALVSIPSVVLGHIKKKLAPDLHNKILFADADMNKADWMTGFGTAIGVLGIGAGLWWADGVVAVLISFGILFDGVTNLRNCLADLIDARATTYDSKDPHPLINDIREALTELDWVAEVDCRVRDQGHVLHSEVFVVPHNGEMPTLEQLEDAREVGSELDWKLHDLVVIPVAELPEQFLPQLDNERTEERSTS